MDGRFLVSLAAFGVVACGARSRTASEAAPEAPGHRVAPSSAPSPRAQSGAGGSSPASQRGHGSELAEQGTPASCPASLQAAEGRRCAPTGVVPTGACRYGAAECACMEEPVCSGAEREADPPERWVWVCRRPPPAVRADGCPGPMPSSGGRCAPIGKRCNYGDCCVTPVECTTAGWRVNPSECPP